MQWVPTVIQLGARRMTAITLSYPNSILIHKSKNDIPYVCSMLTYVALIDEVYAWPEPLV